MNHKHTSGSWNVVNTMPSNALDIAVIFDEQSQVVCSVPKGSSNKPQQERRANARLIAAAPDLLAAMELIDLDGLPEDVQMYARAAIAKATGEAA